MKLYRVSTLVTEYHGYDNVCFNWFRSEPPQSVRPYGELIKGYASGDKYPERAIDEFFTEGEAKGLAAYLRGAHPADLTQIAAVSLPIPHELMGFGAQAVGGDTGFYILEKEPGYALPFPVSGYYDLRHHEPVYYEIPF